MHRSASISDLSLTGGGSGDRSRRANTGAKIRRPGGPERFFSSPVPPGCTSSSDDDVDDDDDDDDAIAATLPTLPPVPKLTAAAAKWLRKSPARPSPQVLSSCARSSAAPDAHIGAIGELVLCERVGGGASGLVHRALYANAFTVACKTVQVEHLDEAARAAVRDHLHATVYNYAHANIVRYLGADVHTDAPRAYHIFMEYFSATLHDIVHGIGGGGALEAHAAASFARQLGNALAYLHDTHNVVHRDVKCDNVFVHAVARRPVLKLGDFGEARTLPVEEGGAATAAATLTRKLTPNRGTPEFMAPEMISLGTGDGGTHYTTAVDIWSTGLVIFEMATARVPYHSEAVDRFQLLEHVARGTRPAWPADVARPAPGTCGAQLVALGEQCTRRRAADRPSARALAHTAAVIEKCACVRS